MSRPRNLPAFLAALHTEARDATVTVGGTPGGTIHLRRGLMTAVDTPGAPGTESLLVKSGRVDDTSWAAARAAGGALDQVLAERGLLTRQQFEVTCTAALFDGAFALALGSATDWEVHPPAPDTVAARAFAPHLVTAEATRRLTTLAQLWGSPAEFARTRLRRADRPRPRLTARHTAVLDAVNGRRTPRDIAFALGRGTYAVMLDLAQLRSQGLLLEEIPAAGRPSTAPRVQGGHAGVTLHPPVTPVPLPQRTPGTHHPHRSDTV